ncbi:MAG: Hsp20/alpha crystallin family protein [Candidatus Aenigmarchaeota archaeon]|nr:Hsp20/alpha crystallin family protein [Candidatus Aenigmarchaeota archaeon]
MVTDDDKKKKNPLAGTPFEGFFDELFGKNGFEAIDWEGGFIESDGNGNYNFNGFPKEIMGEEKETAKPTEKNYPMMLSGKKEYLFQTRMNEKSYTATIEVPCHIKRDEIKIGLTGSDLGISAGNFMKQYTIGFESDTFEIKHYKNGILKLEFAKKGVGN